VSIDIPQLRDMYELPQYNRFTKLMAWYYTSWEKAQHEWALLLSAQYFSKSPLGIPMDRIISETIAVLTERLEVCYAAFIS
jgi:hypothetical protein